MPAERGGFPGEPQPTVDKKDPPNIRKRKGLSRRDFFKLAGSAFLAVGLAGLLLARNEKAREYATEQPFPDLGQLPQTETTPDIASEIKKIIESHRPFTLDYTVEFAHKLVAPLFIQEGKALGFERKLSLKELMDNSTFIPDFNNAEDTNYYRPQDFANMKTLAAKISSNSDAVTADEVNSAYLWTYLEHVGDSYYAQIKDDIARKKDLLIAIYDAGEVSFNKDGHVFFNIAGINGFGREFYDKDTLPGYYLEYQRPDIDTDPTKCDPITFGAAMLKVLVHEWTHLDSYPALGQPVEKAVKPLDASLVHALKVAEFEQNPSAKPITNWETYNFGITGSISDGSEQFRYTGLLEFTTDLLATRLIAHAGLPTVPTYHTGMDYKNMDTLLGKMNMTWGELAGLYYNSDDAEFYRRVGHVLTRSGNVVDQIVAGLKVFSPRGPEEFPWFKDNGTVAGINWSEVHKRVRDVDPGEYVELHQPYSDVSDGVGNWWFYAWFDNHIMEYPIGGTMLF